MLHLVYKVCVNHIDTEYDIEAARNSQFVDTGLTRDFQVNIFAGYT